MSWEDEGELADLDLLGVGCYVSIEQQGVGGQLEALDVEVVLGEADAVVAQFFGEAGLLDDFMEHPLVEIVPGTGHTLLQFRAAANGGQHEGVKLHQITPCSFSRAISASERPRRRWYTRSLS